MARMARDAGTWPDEQQEPAGAGRSRAVPWVATATGVVLLILAPRYGPIATSSTSSWRATTRSGATRTSRR